MTEIDQEVGEVQRQTLKEFLAGHVWALMKVRLQQYADDECRQLSSLQLDIEAVRQRQGRIQMLRMLTETPQMLLFGSKQG